MHIPRDVHEALGGAVLHGLPRYRGLCDKVRLVLPKLSLQAPCADRFDNLVGRFFQPTDLQPVWAIEGTSVSCHRPGDCFRRLFSHLTRQSVISDDSAYHLDKGAAKIPLCNDAAAFIAVTDNFELILTDLERFSSASIFWLVYLHP